MKTLLNLYWNIMFYCTYTLLFYLFNRLLNPIYWLQNKKVRLRLNEYINNIVSFLNKREVDERGIDSGIIIFSTSYICAHTLCFLSFIFWLIYKITRVNVIQMAFNNMLVLSIFFVIFLVVSIEEMSSTCSSSDRLRIMARAVVLVTIPVVTNSSNSGIISASIL